MGLLKENLHSRGLDERKDSIMRGLGRKGSVWMIGIPKES